LIQPRSIVMDVGAPRGNRGHREQLTAHGCEYWYSDLSNKGHRNKITWIDEYRMDCADNRFDVVVTSQTLEHVRWIWVWMKELTRVIKPGGIMASVSPITWAEHRYPFDCWRVMPDGGAALLEWAGLELIKSIKVCHANGQHDARYQMSGYPPVEDLVLIGRKPHPVAGSYDFGDQMF
jgi:SAM-dependent methyltransferase